MHCWPRRATRKAKDAIDTLLLKCETEVQADSDRHTSITRLRSSCEDHRILSEREFQSERKVHRTSWQQVLTIMQRSRRTWTHKWCRRQESLPQKHDVFGSATYCHQRRHQRSLPTWHPREDDHRGTRCSWGLSCVRWCSAAVGITRV